jgi:hypothetical protein
MTKVNLKEGKKMPLGSFSVIIIFSSLSSDIVCSCDRYSSRYSLLREVGLVYLSFNVYFFLLLAEKTKVKKAKSKKQ